MPMRYMVLCIRRLDSLVDGDERKWVGGGVAMWSDGSLFEEAHLRVLVLD